MGKTIRRVSKQKSKYHVRSRKKQSTRKGKRSRLNKKTKKTKKRKTQSKRINVKKNKKTKKLNKRKKTRKSKTVMKGGVTNPIANPTYGAAAPTTLDNTTTAFKAPVTAADDDDTYTPMENTTPAVEKSAYDSCVSACDSKKPQPVIKPVDKLSKYKDDYKTRINDTFFKSINDNINNINDKKLAKDINFINHTYDYFKRLVGTEIADKSFLKTRATTLLTKMEIYTQNIKRVFNLINDLYKLKKELDYVIFRLEYGKIVTTIKTSIEAYYTVINDESNNDYYNKYEYTDIGLFIANLNTYSGEVSNLRTLQEHNDKCNKEYVTIVDNYKLSMSNIDLTKEIKGQSQHIYTTYESGIKTLIIKIKTNKTNIETLMHENENPFIKKIYDLIMINYNKLDRYIVSSGTENMRFNTMKEKDQKKQHKKQQKRLQTQQQYRERGTRKSN
jgi:hypothetical protein